MILSSESHNLTTSDFDYQLPRELIAAEPPERRGASRLLVLNRQQQGIEHREFDDLAGFLNAGDVLVVNDSRVMRARLRGVRVPSGGAVEILLLQRVAAATAGKDAWRSLCRPAKKLTLGQTLNFGEGELTATVIEELSDGERTIAFDSPDIMSVVERIGEIPLPPYIVQRRKELRDDTETGNLEPMDAADSERYQTVYARHMGSVAAPTAGLHFSEALLGAIKDRGVNVCPVTLHVGAGTFKPVEVENPADHTMHREHYTISQETADAINAARTGNRRVVAVGTTAVRAVESSAAANQGIVTCGTTSTALLILPGYRFQAVDAMVTNFHLPRSTLLMLVSAFAGHSSVMDAYRKAIENQYRFYSYGDAMLIT